MDGISLNGVTKSFGETKALIDANLVARKGEIHAIVGENGSGKSTLAKIISGVLEADAGSVDVFGMHPKSPREAIDAGVATIFQEVLLAEELSIQDNLFAGIDGFWRKSSKGDDRRRQSREIIKRLTGTDYAPETKIAELPLSVRQWIVIARALIRKPKALIFDESSAALDLDATRRLHDEMRSLKEQNCCILLVTHRIAELVQIADAATVLRDGETVGQLSKSEINEENLLRLMSATSDKSIVSRLKVQSTRRSKEIIKARDVKIAPKSDVFDFSLAEGQIVGLAGLDGAGQAAFAKALAGIQPIFGGSISVETAEPVSLSGLDHAESLGVTYVSGDRKKEGIFPALSIIENFGMALLARHSNLSGVIDKVSRATDFSQEASRMGIKFGLASDKITTLSGGNQQKVLIGRAFAKKPKVIVFNDPARGVDIGTKQELYKQLRSFAMAGGAVVYLSSELEEFYDFADRVDVFFANRIFKSFVSDQINEEHLLPALFGKNTAVVFDDEKTGVA